MNGTLRVAPPLDDLYAVQIRSGRILHCLDQERRSLAGRCTQQLPSHGYALAVADRSDVPGLTVCLGKVESTERTQDDARPGCAVDLSSAECVEDPLPVVAIRPDRCETARRDLPGVHRPQNVASTLRQMNIGAGLAVELVFQLRRQAGM
jgi:hypothetical protein